MNTTGKLTLVKPGESLWPQVIDIDTTHFARSWNYEQWMHLDMTHHYLYVWSEVDLAQGFALFNHLPGDNATHLLKICLLPQKRGSGLAQKMWSLMSAQFKEQGLNQVFLEVEEGNYRAIQFYNKLGFKVLRTIKGYYSDGANGISMLLML